MRRSQLLAAGLSRKQIQRRVERGSLLPQFQGVYRVGHRAPGTEATYMAAVLACGDDALLCGLAAAHLLGVLKGKPPPPEVIAPTLRRARGVTTRRGRRQATRYHYIPVTTVPETLVDLAAHLSLDALARACHEAGVKYKTTPAEVEAVLARRPNAKGAANLRRVTRGDAPVTLSRMEKRFLRALRKRGLPLPVTNRRAGSHRVDCRWPEHRLTVELDSYAFHNSRHSWEQDRRREREARARGDDFRRYTWDDVTEENALLAELAPLIVNVPVEG